LDISQIAHLILELVVGFIVLLIITKILGKTQIKQITPFDFISALVLGELLGNAIYDKDINLLFIIIALLVWGALIFTVEKIALKFKRTRKVLDGEPLIVIRNGQIDINILKKEKLNTNELLSLLRSKDVFSVREVEYAILEPSGSLSVLRKSQYSIPAIKEFNIEEKPVYLPVSFILDGEVLKENLKTSGFNLKWLEKELQKQGISKIKDVFYAEWKADEGLHLVKVKNDL
jgi:uncharacterized membrane protein YcaP (DUF421 family)